MLDVRKVTVLDIGSLRFVCKYGCGAFTFANEKMDCCKKGQIRGHDVSPLPAGIMKMLPNNIHSVPQFVKLFRKYSRSINTAFAYASTAMKLQDFTHKRPGPPVVVLRGAFSRLIWDGQNADDITASNALFAQIYFFTTDPAQRVEIRWGLSCMKDMKPEKDSKELLRNLEITMLKHPLAGKYQSNHVVHPDIPTGAVTLETETKPIPALSGAYNKNTGDLMGGLMPDLSVQDMAGRQPRQLSTNVKSGATRKFQLNLVSEINGKADALQYPLLHFGETAGTTPGWNCGMKTNELDPGAGHLTVAAFYRHRLQVSACDLLTTRT
jgi:hypothetical protein